MSFDSYLRYVGPAATVITGTTFALSVIENWSFFFVIGPSMLGLMSTQDYIVSALSWLPITIALAFGYIVFVVMISGASIPSAVRETSPLEIPINASGIGYVMSAFGIIIVLSILFLSPSSFITPYAVLLSIVLFVAFVTIKHRFGSDHARKFDAPLFATIAILGVIALGHDRANLELSEWSGEYELEITNKSDRTVNILKTLSGGLLFRVPLDDTVQFVRWSEIESIAVVRRKPSTRVRLCEWFSSLC